MIKLRELIEEARYVGGMENDNSANTSLHTMSISKSIRWLYNRYGDEFGEGPIIDYGAGRNGRHAEFFRNKGIKTYGYDYTWESGEDGWRGVSKELPGGRFKVGISCFVLNVVTEDIEDGIISWMDEHCERVYHITRNRDIFKTIINGLIRRDKGVVEFFRYFRGEVVRQDGGKEYKMPVIKDLIIDGKPVTEEEVMDFSIFGIKTSKGFQRIPMLEGKGFKLIKIDGQFKIYSK